MSDILIFSGMKIEHVLHFKDEKNTFAQIFSSQMFSTAIAICKSLH